MTKRILIDAVHAEETRVVIAEHSKIVDFDFITSSKKQIKGNIYLAKITRVEPSLQAAFVEYGGGKQGFLPFAEIHPDYYQIPVSDRKRLIEEQEAMLREQEEAEEAEELRREQNREAREQEREGGRRGGRRGRGRYRNREQETTPDPMMGEDADPLNQLGVPESAQEQAPLDPWEAEMHATAQPVDYTPRASNDNPETPQQDLLQDLVTEFNDKDFHHAQETPKETKREEYLPPSAAEGTEMVTRSEPIEPAFDAPALDAASAEVQPSELSDAESSDMNGDAAESGEVETLGNEEEQVRETKKRSFIRRYKIQEVIKRNQIVLVQVIKEERGNKGVSLTTYISLAGRYCVLMPNSPKGGGISRKISSSEDRRRLKQIAAELEVTPGMSAIIRTAGLDRTRAEIRRDFEYLIKMWDTIRERTLSSTAPALIYEESDIIKRTIRDLYTPDIEEIVIEGEEAFNNAKEFMKLMMPSQAPRTHEHKGNVPLFHAYGVEEQLIAMHEPNVRLRSGGYIVIAPTEALTAIDVNSGRYTGERNIEETATKINIEAAYEVARQIRLRDFGGLIVIDFIDMMDLRNKKAVERALKEALRQDRAKIQIGRISAFGLLEMSRQRLRPSISETSTITCPHCLGKGVVRSHESLAIQVIRALEKEASTGQFGELKLIVRAEFGLFLLNQKRDHVSRLEKEFNIRVNVMNDEELNAGSFRIDKIKSRSQDRGRRPRYEETGPAITASDIEMPPMREEEPQDMAPASDLPPVETEFSANGTGEEFVPQEGGRRQRGERGGRRRGGRSRNRRDREYGERHFDDTQQPAPVYEGLPVDEGDVAPMDAVHLDGNAPQTDTYEGDTGERPRRQRWKNDRGGRGGRGRNRRGNREDRQSSPAYEGLPADEGSFNAPTSYRSEPQQDFSAAPRYTPKAEPVVTSLLPGQTAPESYRPAQQAEDSDKPKRQGWWKRLVDSGK